MGLGISIMIKKPEKQKPGIFSFMQPLSVSIWLLILLALLATTLVLFVVSRMSPYEWQIEETHSRLTYTNDFSISNSMWFAMAALMRQGSDMSPRSVKVKRLGL
jgi:magnesium-transporting ATPase (P-type)